MTEDDTPVVRCPSCPMCGASPDRQYIRSHWPHGAVCPDPDCITVAWTPTASLDANLLHTHNIENARRKL